jgi:hypothetical protein
VGIGRPVARAGVQRRFLQPLLSGTVGIGRPVTRACV